jgi:hypothetical protein
LARCVPGLKYDVLARDPAEISQRREERGRRARFRRRGGLDAENPDARDLAHRLRLYGERRGEETAGYRAEERAPVHEGSSVWPKMSGRGTGGDGQPKRPYTKRAEAAKAFLQS